MGFKSRNIIIDFEPISRRVYYSSDISIYEILKELRISIRSICGGLGTCGKCKILIQNGLKHLNPPTKSELKFLSAEDIKNGYRLACQTKLNQKNISILEKINPPQFRIFLPSEFLLEDFKILTSGMSKGVQLKPAIEKIYVEVEEPSLKKPIPDFERIKSAVISKVPNLKSYDEINIDFDILNDLPDVLRKSKHKITLIFRKKKIIAYEPNNTENENYGIAFDIGTTTIVGYLINLNDGKIYAVDSKLNSQTAFGEDVITRLTYIKEDGKNLQKLNSAVISDLNEIIINTCKKANINPSKIYEATIVGNSVMHHIFLGINPVNIGLSPFIPVIQKSLNVKAKSLSLNISDSGNVFVAPIIAGFVGADTIGVILSSKIEEEKDLTLAIDIGTNGEIIIGNRELLAVGSCAAGSALEGAHLSDGMRAAAGAIDSVKINPKSLDVSYTTIYDKNPIGICGSGLVDAVAEMLRSKIITRSGNFNKDIIDHERFIKIDKNYEFVLAKKEESPLNKEITLTQGDIRQLQMAKAAFYSGSQLILKYLGDNLKIQQIYLAGAFGNYINAANAKFIGMIPDIEDNRIYQIGNAAGIGAQHCLLNKDLRIKAQQLLNKIKYVEIAVQESFQKEYAEAMYFPHYHLNYFPNLKQYEEIPKR